MLAIICCTIDWYLCFRYWCLSQNIIIIIIIIDIPYVNNLQMRLLTNLRPIFISCHSMMLINYISICREYLYREIINYEYIILGWRLCWRRVSFIALSYSVGELSIITSLYLLLLVVCIVGLLCCACSVIRRDVIWLYNIVHSHAFSLRGKFMPYCVPCNWLHYNEALYMCLWFICFYNYVIHL